MAAAQHIYIYIGFTDTAMEVMYVEGRQCTYNVTLKHFGATVVIVEKQ